MKSWIHRTLASIRPIAFVLAAVFGAGLSWAQIPTPSQPTPPAQATKHVIPAFSPAQSQGVPDSGFRPESPKVGTSQAAGASQVFPDGGFPPAPAAPEAKSPVLPPPVAENPAQAAAPATIAAKSAQLPVVPDYAPSGLTPRDVQEVPGVLNYFLPRPKPLPDYFYQPAYYEQPIVGPRTVEEYAPPGYEARDQQLGPGTPEFIFITPPIPVTPEERERFVTRGIMPGSFLVPGTDTSFRLRGFVRLMGLFDFNPIGVPDAFVTNSIPVPQEHGHNYNWSARMSRIATETWTPTPFYDWTLHTFVEADFFNGPGQAPGGGGNPFRLRHAFIDYGYFRLGQQNTVFMDATTWPSLVDFQGPAGWVNQRRPGARVTIPLSDKWFWAGGIEQPFSDISTNGLGSNVQDVPDFATHIRYEADYGQFQVSALMRSIGYQPTGGETTRRAGYGMSLGTTFHPWAYLLASNPVRKDNPTALERCRIIGQYTFGWGIGRYINDEVGQGLDGQVDPATGGFKTIYSAAYVLSYEQWWTERWLSNFTYSQTIVASNGDQPSSTYVGAKYLGASLWFIPFRNMSFGIEYLWGERSNVNEQRGKANRANASVQYNF
jgi:hypothetical protein